MNVTPCGKVPNSESVGAGVPTAATVKVPATSAENVAVLAVVITGGTAPFVGVKATGEEAVLKLPLLALTVQD